MRLLPKRFTDSNQIVQEFQNRQKRLVIVAFTCFAVMVPLAIKLRGINAFLSVAVLGGFGVFLVGFYFWTFRCPGCGTRVQQRRSMLRMPLRCLRCGALLDPV